MESESIPEAVHQSPETTQLRIEVACLVSRLMNPLLVVAELLSPSAGSLDSPSQRHFPPDALAVTVGPQMTQRTEARPRV